MGTTRLDEAFELERAFPDDVVDELGVSWVELSAALDQAHLSRARKTNASIKACAAELVQRYEAGESLLDLARAKSFAPWHVARVVAEDVLTKSRALRKSVKLSAALRDPEAHFGAELPRLALEVRECMEEDPHHSPYSERVRRASGLLHEFKLRRELAAAKLPFEGEDELRRRGFSKTPDALLILPVAVPLPVYLSLSLSRVRSVANSTSASDGRVSRGGEGASGGGSGNKSAAEKEVEVVVVRWIDSKAMFGDWQTHAKDNREQFESYVNRFGPGLVIYWFGFDEAVANCYEDVSVAREFPKELVSLSF